MSILMRWFGLEWVLKTPAYADRNPNPKKPVSI